MTVQAQALAFNAGKKLALNATAAWLGPLVHNASSLQLQLLATGRHLLLLRD